MRFLKKRALFKIPLKLVMHQKVFKEVSLGNKKDNIRRIRKQKSDQLMLKIFVLIINNIYLRISII